MATAPQILLPTPHVTSTPWPTPTPLPTPTASALRQHTMPTPTPFPLARIWRNLQAFQFAPVLDNLAILPKSERNDPFFGIADAIGSEGGYGPILRGSGAATDRLEIRWDAIEPTSGHFDFATLDSELQDAARLHYHVIGLIDGTPLWAAANPAAGAASPPAGMALPLSGYSGTDPWTVFLQRLVQHTHNQITTWEIWNEPNTAEFWAGTTTQYALLFTEASLTIHALAPHDTVLVGGLVDDNGSWLSRMVTALCSFSDCPASLPQAIAWHVYDNPRAVIQLSQITRKLFASWHRAPQLWITEANVPVNDPQGPADAVVGPDSVTLKQGAAFIAQIFSLARFLGYQEVVIYRASDVDAQGHYWGLIRQDFTARPSFYAFRTAAKELGHTRPLTGSTTLTQGITDLSFCRNNFILKVIWNSNPHATAFYLPLSTPIRQVLNAEGVALPYSSTSSGFRINLPPANPPTSYQVPLGTPRYVITALPCH